MRALRWKVAVVAATIACPIVVACSGSTGESPGAGNTIVNDTRDASPRPPPNPDPGDDAGDAMTAPLYPEAGKYPGVAQCGDCTCSADTHYCFGGATPRGPMLARDFTPLASDAAGPPACVVIDAGSPQLGCNPSPAGCTDCACVLKALQPSYACYLVCASDGAGQPMTVYCPNK